MSQLFLTIFSHNHVDWDFFIHETSLLHHMHGRIAEPMASAERDVLSLEEVGKKWGFRTWLMTCHGAPTATAHTSGAKNVRHTPLFIHCTQVSVRHSPSMGRAQLTQHTQQTQPQRRHKMINPTKKRKKRDV